MFWKTLNINVPTDDFWVKVKLRINDEVRASWCRVIPGIGVHFYNIEGHMIDKESNRISIIEVCDLPGKIPQNIRRGI